jgi:hypothetical protein
MRKRSPAAVVCDFTSAERALKSGVRVPAETIADLIEQSPSEPMPRTVGIYVVWLLRGRSLLPTGRKAMNHAKWDFIIADAKESYQAKRASGMSCEDAAEETRKEFVKHIGNISTKRLLNLFSESKRCEVSEGDETAPEQRDAPDHFPEDRWIPFSEQCVH